jgi:hypothetical protein
MRRRAGPDCACRTQRTPSRGAVVLVVFDRSRASRRGPVSAQNRFSFGAWPDFGRPDFTPRCAATGSFIAAHAISGDAHLNFFRSGLPEAVFTMLNLKVQYNHHAFKHVGERIITLVTIILMENGCTAVRLHEKVAALLFCRIDFGQHRRVRPRHLLVPVRRDDFDAVRKICNSEGGVRV